MYTELLFGESKIKGTVSVPSLLSFACDSCFCCQVTDGVVVSISMDRQRFCWTGLFFLLPPTWSQGLAEMTNELGPIRLAAQNQFLNDACSIAAVLFLIKQQEPQLLSH